MKKPRSNPGLLLLKLISEFPFVFVRVFQQVGQVDRFMADCAVKV